MRIDQDVLEILSALQFPARGLARLAEQVDRRTYARVDVVLRALGGRWSRRDKAHAFSGDARGRIDQAITTGVVQTNADLGHFPSSPALAAWLVQHADVRPGCSALEPSAGSGRVVGALLAAGASSVTAIERDPIRRDLLRRMPLSPRGTLQVVEVDDFMTYDASHRSPPSFDRVVMNPPFCRVGIGDHLDHVARALGMLSPGGILVSVLPSGLRFRRDRRHVELRELCERRGTIVDLPEGSFKSAGTDVRTVAVRIEAGS